MNTFLVPHIEGAGTGTPHVPRSAGTQREQEPTERLPRMTTPQPSIAALKLSRPELITAADTFRDKAQEAHDRARKWQNRALLAEAQLATLRAAYEPPRTKARELTDAAGNPEPELPTTPAESE